jgi:hypothetical protein
MAQEQKKKNKQGMTLHKWIATGGKPKERKNANSWKGGK